jgi:hypothetical protein
MSGKETSFAEYHPDTNQRIIRGIVLKEDLIIDGHAFQTAISFVDCHFYGRILVRGGTFSGFDVSGGRLAQPLIVSGGVFENSFVLAEIDALPMTHDVSPSVVLAGGQFNCNVTICKGAFQSIVIGNADLRAVSITSSAGSNFNHGLKPYIEKLLVAPRRIAVLELRDVPVGHIELFGVLEKGIYSFANLKVHRLELRYFINQGQVWFDGVMFRDACKTGKKAGPTLVIEHTDLGKTRFHDMDFTKIDTIEIASSELMQVESSNTTWFSSAQLRERGKDGNLKQMSNGATRHLFRQLKHAMIQQGNRIDQLYFQAVEMDAYRRSLTLRKNFADVIILMIGKYTNNFGTNYILPIIWIIAVAVVTFVCSARIQGLALRNVWGGLFVVLNPAHPLDYLVPKDKISNAFMAVDFVGRVLISILIYQLIAPFRKFVH